MVKDRRKPIQISSISADDHAVWQLYTRSVQPFRQACKTLPVSPTVKQQPVVKSFNHLQMSTTPVMPSFVPSLTVPVSAAPILSAKKIKRPQTIDGRLDLHGLTQIQAYRATLRFIDAHYQRHSQILIIITGKGFMRIHDHPRPSLAEALPQWLSQPPFNGYVRSFSTAHLKHGGRGAYYIYLKKT